MILFIVPSPALRRSASVQVSVASSSLALKLGPDPDSESSSRAEAEELIWSVRLLSRSPAGGVVSERETWGSPEALSSPCSRVSYGTARLTRQSAAKQETREHCSRWTSWIRTFVQPKLLRPETPMNTRFLKKITSQDLALYINTAKNHFILSMFILV